MTEAKQRPSIDIRACANGWFVGWTRQWADNENAIEWIGRSHFCTTPAEVAEAVKGLLTTEVSAPAIPEILRAE